MIIYQLSSEIIIIIIFFSIPYIKINQKAHQIYSGKYNQGMNPPEIWRTGEFRISLLSGD